MAASAPPAYTATADSHSPVHTPPSRPTRSVQDLRSLILGNAAILKPRERDDPVELIVAKHQPSIYQPSAEEPPPAISHYAFLVMRKPKEFDIHIVLKGEPRDSIEEALEFLLERTQTVMEEMLLKHGRHMDSGCCVACGRSLRPDRRERAVFGAYHGTLYVLDHTASRTDTSKQHQQAVSSHADMSPDPPSAATAGSNTAKIAAETAINELLTTIKVTARVDDNNCPKHKKLKICSCPSQLNSLTPSEIEAAKRNRFLLLFLAYLLEDTSTWCYTGKQASHVEFVMKRGDTPKHFLREYLRTDVCTREFAPAGRQSVTLDALLKVSVAKNAEWKATHDTQEAARDAYLRGVRDEHMSDDSGYMLKARDIPLGLENSPPGTVFNFIEYKAGPPWHDTRVHVLPHTFIQTSGNHGPDGKRSLYYIDVRIVKLVPCHEDCEATARGVWDGWPDMMVDAARRVYGVKGALLARSDDLGMDGEGGRWRIYDAGSTEGLAEREETRRVINGADQLVFREVEIRGSG